MRCLRTCLRRDVVVLRCPRTWWLLSWSSRPIEGLSDRDGTRAFRDRISWKVACGLALTDEGFDFSVLTYWRTRLRLSEAPERIFDAVRAVIDATGVLKGRTRRALDSTLLDDAVATQDTVTQLISAIRRVRRMVPGARREVTLGAHDYEALGKPLIAWDDPVAKAELVDALVSDALRLLGALEEKTSDEEAAGALGLLALVAGQETVEQDDDGTWRIADRVAPDRVISTVDPGTRHMHKSRSESRDGYKAHIAVEPETGLVASAIVTPANVSDAKTALDLVAAEPGGLEILGDSAYGSGETRAHLRAHGHRQLIKPIPLRRAVPGGFCRDDFAVDHQPRTMTCPAGITVPIAPRGQASFGASPRAARSETAAPRRCVASRRSSIPMTTSSLRPAVNGNKESGSRSTAVGAPWSSAPSRGWSPTITGASDSAASRKPPWPLPPGRRHQPQAFGQPRTRTSGRMAARSGLTRSAQAQAVKEGPRFGHCPPGWPTSTLFVSALRSDMS